MNCITSYTTFHLNAAAAAAGDAMKALQLHRRVHRRRRRRSHRHHAPLQQTLALALILLARRRGLVPAAALRRRGLDGPQQRRRGLQPAAALRRCAARPPHVWLHTPEEQGRTAVIVLAAVAGPLVAVAQPNSRRVFEDAPLVLLAIRVMCNTYYQKHTLTHTHTQTCWSAAVSMLLDRRLVLEEEK